MFYYTSILSILIVFGWIKSTQNEFGYSQHINYLQTNEDSLTIDTVYYPSGSVWMVIPRLNGLEDGEQKWYSEDGQLTTIIRYSKGLKNGPWIEYYNHGHVKTYGRYQYGARDSLWVEKYYNKSISSIGSYYPDINYLIVREQDSIQYLFTLNKDLDEVDSIEFTPDVFNGLKSIYGNPLTGGLGFPIEIHFKDQNWKYYNEEGKLVKEEFCDKGKLVNTINY